MKNSRAPLVLALSLGIIAVLAVLYLLDRRMQGPQPTGGGHRVQASADGGTKPTDHLKPSSRVHIGKLVDRFGGFTSRGRVLLTRPGGPGANLVVRLRGEVAGETVEAEGLSAEDGRFRLPTLPRAGRYTVAVEGRRVQPFAKEGVLPPGEGELHLGNLVAERYYFVAGRVVGENKGVVAGAKVALVNPTGDSSFSFFQASVEASRGEPTVAATESGPDGRFRMRLARPGIFTLRARSEGWAPHYRRNLIVGGAADVRVQVALTPGHEVVGYVLDAAGHASAEAAVVFYGTGYGSFGAAKEVTHTDETGKFAFRVEPSTRDYMLSVVPERGLDLNTRFTVPLDEDLVLRLPGSGTLLGRVVDGRNDQPLVGADVLVGVSSTQNAMRMPDFTKAVRTDSSGVFRVEGVGKGRISTLSVRAPGFGDLRLNAFQATDEALWGAVKALALTGQGQHELPPLALLPGKELRGTIRDELTNRPLAGAVVELWDFIMGNRATRTEDDGTYRFAGVGDRVVMIVSKRGYATFRDPATPGLALSRGSTATRDISLELGGTLEGTVRAAGGEPVPRALVRLLPADRGYGAWRTALALRDIWTYTGPGGNYRLTGVPAVRLYAEAVASGFDSGSSEEQEVSPGGTQQGVGISLRRGTRVAGIVVTEAGTPLASARVTVAREPEAQDETAAWRALSEGAFTFADRQGRFSLANVPVGSLLIRAEARGFATLTYRQGDDRGGQGTASLRFELGPAVVIAGRVVDKAGRPVDSCWLRAKHTVSPKGTLRREPFYARVSSDGTFRLDNLPAGTYTLDARSNSPLPGRPKLRDLRRTDVEGGTQDLVLTLETK
ncbi:MAG: carboxypeptidase regulatory-like domain-containing protein [Planctomycetota bacterium]|jgi:hypothetical protein